MPPASKDVSIENEATVVVYSSYRTASTWLWTRMRKRNELYCYYEVFNEALASLTREQAKSAGSADWRSRHPEVVSYREEYLPLINGQGIVGFPEAENTDSRFISYGGLNSPLDDDVHHYLRTLVNHARRQGKIPVLSGQRMLGRSHGIREAFPGFHILLVRNLFHQWNSYSGQLRTGNPYFLWTLNRTLSLASQDSFIAHLAGIFSKDTVASIEAWTSAENSDDLFCYFVSFHIYFYLETRSNVDLVIDSTRLAELDGNYCRQVEKALSAGIGVEIDFTDVCVAIDFPRFPIWQPALCRSRISDFVEVAHSMRGSTTEERDFADKMLTDLWSEWERFTFYSLSASEHVADLDARLVALNASLEALEESRTASSYMAEDLAQMRDACAREEGANQSLREQIERQRAVSIQRDRDLARLYQRVVDLQVHVAAADERTIHRKADSNNLDEDGERYQGEFSGLLDDREGHAAERSGLENEVVALQVEITQAAEKQALLEDELRMRTEELILSSKNLDIRTLERDQLRARLEELNMQIVQTHVEEESQETGER